MEKEEEKVININIGVLGHVDSGKTSICKLLSKICSTASMDKSKQSQERGITLDLGFSCFQLDKFQFTLVDCPGHASLIKTVIGGSQIIDYIFLVIDINKGIQTQTAECIVIAQIIQKPVFLLLNKCDLCESIEIKQKQISQILSKLKLQYYSVVMSASKSIGISELQDLLLRNVKVPQRDKNNNGEFSVLVDHCFNIKGQGTVTTGTVIQGQLQVGDIVEFPQFHNENHKKIISIQMFRKNIKKAVKGDRIAIMFKPFDSNTVERTIISSKNMYKPFLQAIFTFTKIQFFKPPIISKHKYHITSGHQTVMATLYIIKSQTLQNHQLQSEYQQQQSKQQQQILNQYSQFDINQEYTYEQQIEDQNNNEQYFIILDFEQEMLFQKNGFYIGSNLAINTNKQCRLAFYGNLIQSINLEEKLLKVFRNKQREGKIEKQIDEYTLLVVNLFKKQSNIHLFLNYPVKVHIDQEKILDAKIQCSFGNSGKVKILLQNPLDMNYSEVVKQKPIFMIYKKYFLNKKYNK